MTNNGKEGTTGALLHRTVAVKNPAARYRFSSFELQLDERRLLDGGRPVAIGPRAFDLLTVLVERAGHLVTKDELLERAWPKVIVEEAALQMQISSLRKILGRDAILTVTGRGYRFAQEATCVPADEIPPEIAPDAAPAHNLPQPLSSFVGREGQVSELKGLLNNARLLTLVGSGGCGKTRLALHMATDLVDQYPDGIWLVELAALSDPQLVPMTVGHVLGLKEQPGVSWTHTIAAQLGPRTLLLILDNAEHLLPACAELSHALLAKCPKLSILATSRERLGLIGEAAYRVPSLSVPQDRRATPTQVADSEAGRLFIDRARLQQAHFSVTPDNSAALASICRQLGGIPLAIELAAARIRQMPVQEVSRRLDQRFDLLTGGSRVALPRHRTLRSLIDWSYDLLNRDEQALLCRVSVFAGGCTLEAVASVCAGDGIEEKQVLELLTSLTDKSLLLAKESVGETRYELLDTVRHYAREHLGEDGKAPPSLLHRHFQYMHAFARRAESRLASDDQHLWLERLEVEHDNLRAALAWSRVNARSAHDGLHLASCLGWFWHARGYFREGGQWLTLLLAAAPDGKPDSVRAYALRGAANLAALAGDYDRSRTLSDEALTLFRQLEDRKGISHVLTNLGTMALELGDYAAARPLLQETLEIRMALGDQQGVCNALGNLGHLEWYCQRYAEARSLLERGLALQNALGNRRIMAQLFVTLGAVLRELKDFRSAHARLKAGLLISGELKHREIIVWCLEEFAALAVATHQPAKAAALWGRAEQLREAFDIPMSAFNRAQLARQIFEVRHTMADDLSFDAAWMKGRLTPLEEGPEALPACFMQ